jgi:hypothetical protein
MTRCREATLPGAASLNCIASFVDWQWTNRLMTSPRPRSYHHADGL